MTNVATKLRASVFSSISLAALMAATSAMADADSCPDTLRYADTGVEGLEELRRSFGPFVDLMEEITTL